MLKEIIPSKFKIVDGNCSGDSQSFNGLVVLNDYFACGYVILTPSMIASFQMLSTTFFFCIEDIEFNSFFQPQRL